MPAQLIDYNNNKGHSNSDCRQQQGHPPALHGCEGINTHCTRIAQLPAPPLQTLKRKKTRKHGGKRRIGRENGKIVISKRFGNACARAITTIPFFLKGK